MSPAGWRDRLGAAAGPRRPHARNGMVRIAYQQGGAGPPLVLVGGLGHGRWSWEPVIADLAKDFLVVPMDNRGSVPPDAPMGPYFTRLLAADVLVAWRRRHRQSQPGRGQPRRHDRPADRQRPARTGRQAGAGVHHPRWRHDHADAAGGGGRAQRAAAAARDEAARAEHGIRLALAPATIRRRPRLARRLAAARAAHLVRPGAWIAQAAAGMLFDLSGAQRRMRHRTLIVQGTEDMVMHPGNAATLAHLIPDAELVWFEGAGHLP